MFAKSYPAAQGEIRVPTHSVQTYTLIGTVHAKSYPAARVAVNAQRTSTGSS